LLLAQPSLKSFSTSPQRLQDGFRGRCKSALQNCQSESDSSLSTLVFQSIGAIELVTNVVRNTLVESRFGIGQLVADGVRPSFREQRRPIELEQLFLD
jgi:hypothetical protein